MTREEVFATLTDIFRDVFDDDDIELTDATTADDIEDWDSLEQINLVVACEKKFNVKFDMKEIQALKNVGEMVDTIVGKLSQKSIQVIRYITDLDEACSYKSLSIAQARRVVERSMLRIESVTSWMKSI